MAALDQPTRDVLDRLRVDVNAAPAVTPALLTYLRGLGLDLSTAEDIRAQRLGRIKSATTENVATADRDYEQRRKSTTGDLIRRGVLQSGEAGTRYGRLASEQQQRISDIYSTQARGTEEVEQAFGTTRDALRRTALERLIDVEQQEATRKASSEAETRAIEAQQKAQEAYYRQLEELAKKGMA
jgi:hypothetical protein